VQEEDAVMFESFDQGSTRSKAPERYARNVPLITVD
jgi:hypothetical protein